MHPLIRKARNIIRLTGIEINKFPHGIFRRRKHLLDLYNVSLILDVGANEGQYAMDMRDIGFKGKIISFEPFSAAFEKLRDNSKKDRNWQVHNIALGDEDKELSLNIANNSQSSSFFEMQTAHLEAAPDANYVKDERITVQKLDSIFNSLSIATEENVFLKIDVQGFEKKVLNGAAEALKKIVGIQIEMSIVELYEGESTYRELIDFLERNGFTLCAIESGFFNPATGQLLQIDGVFFRLDKRNQT